MKNKTIDEFQAGLVARLAPRDRSSARLLTDAITLARHRASLNSENRDIYEIGVKLARFSIARHPELRVELDQIDTKAGHLLARLFRSWRSKRERPRLKAIGESVLTLATMLERPKGPHDMGEQQFLIRLGR